MPSDRTPSQAEIDAALAVAKLHWALADEEDMRDILSAAATARPDQWDMRQELWECYCASGADPDGADARHLNAGETLRAVQELRADYDEALEEASLGEGEGER